VARRKRERISAERWQEDAASVWPGMADWRAAHPKATFSEIEAALDERLNQVRARGRATGAAPQARAGRAGPAAAQCRWGDDLAGRQAVGGSQDAGTRAGGPGGGRDGADDGPLVLLAAGRAHRVPAAGAGRDVPARGRHGADGRGGRGRGRRRTSTRCWPCAPSSVPIAGTRSGPSSVPASAPTPAHTAARQAAASAPETGASAPTLTSPSPPVPKTIVDGRPTTAHPWKRRFLPHRPAPPAANCRAPTNPSAAPPAKSAPAEGNAARRLLLGGIPVSCGPGA